MSIKVKSPAFGEGDSLPKEYTCDGGNIPPPLQWSHVPKATRTLAVICEDIDAPHPPFTHWMVYNLPADTRELPEDMPPADILEMGADQGSNDFRELGYGGACPSSGHTHRYVFRVIALDDRIRLRTGASRESLDRAIEGHILDEGRLTASAGR